MEANSEYTKAYEISAIAIKNFSAAQKAFRALEIGDAQFLAAKKVYDAAMAEYDKAYAAEVN